MPEEFVSLQPVEIEAKRAEGWTLLDVRTDEEWAEARIEGATHIPMDQLTGRVDELDDQMICVCAVGGRSARVAQFLAGQGKQVANLEGGLSAWAEAGLPLST